MRAWLIVALCFTLGASTASAADAPVFEKDVRPILKAYCVSCHGEQGQTKAGLDLRLRRLMVAGGDSGAAIVPGKPEESHLLEKLRKGEMPPGKDAKKLTAEQVAVIERWIAAGAPTLHAEPDTIGPGLLITEADRQHWSFQPIVRPPVPKPKQADRVRSPVDAFLLLRLEAKDASFAADADRRTLIRRAFFDLVGLPPSPEELDQALGDKSADWYEKLIDRLLASPGYGERWGRHWLDVAGYADSDGSTSDSVRTHAYRYRDYVIRSFNNDKPFDQFIREQLAGDEMVGPVSGTPTAEQAEKLIATGFLQSAPDGTTGAADRAAAHDQLVSDTIKIVSSSLLGLTVGCAKCHDHRFDPISQDDYYRFRAIFEPALAPQNWQGKNRQVTYSTPEDRQNAEARLKQQELAVVLRVAETQIEKLPEDQREAARIAFDTPEEKRTPEQKKLLVDSKLNITIETIGQFDRTATMELNRVRQMFTPRGDFLQAIRETAFAPKTFLFHRGDPKQPKHELSPGELTILQGKDAEAIPSKAPKLSSTGRRLAYAKQLTDGTHPLVARVIVNRVWLNHFGRGLCATPADLGTNGEPPSHPELIDWLARDFMDQGWSLKKLHRQIMTSTAYRQGSRRSESLESIDPQNHLIGGFPVRRLEAEIVRDAILAASGKLNRKPFGAALPVMRDPAGEIVVGLDSNNAGIPLAVIPMFGEEFRRSVYVQVRRTMPVTFMQMFDAPALEPNCEARTATTSAPQSLVLMNSPFMLQQSLHFAARLRKEAGTDPKEQIDLAWKVAFSRAPTPEERTDAAAFLQGRVEYFKAHPPTAAQRVVVPGRSAMMMRPQGPDVLVNDVARADPEALALALLCQMLLSCNEFLYVS